MLVASRTAITPLRSRGVQKYSSKGLPLQRTPALPGCTLTRATEALRRPVPHHHPWTGAAGSRGTKVSSAVSAGASPKVMVEDTADSVVVVSSVIRKVFQWVQRATGCWAWCGCSAPSYTLRFDSITRPRRVLGSMRRTASSTSLMGRCSCIQP